MTGSTSKRSLLTYTGFYGTKIKIQIQIQYDDEYFVCKKLTLHAVTIHKDRLGECCC